MKKGLLIVLGMFLIVSTVEATNSKATNTKIEYNYAYENSVNFEERGVEFFIFTNGEFDFNTNYNSAYYNHNGERVSRNSGIRINRDYRGRVNRIGNSFVNYDAYGNVTRIGNVYMRYNRGRLTDVGNLKVRYDHWGTPAFYGNVKDNYYQHNGVRINLNIGTIFDYNNSYFSHRDFSINYSKIREDNNFYYYRAKSKVGKRSQILRRRKPTSIRLNKNQNTRRNNTTYRRPSTVSSKRKVTSEKRSNNTTYRRPSTVKRNKNVTLKNKRDNNTSSRRPTTTTKAKVSTERRKGNTSNRKSTTKRSSDNRRS